MLWLNSSSLYMWWMNNFKYTVSWNRIQSWLNHFFFRNIKWYIIIHVGKAQVYKQIIYIIPWLNMALATCVGVCQGWFYLYWLSRVARIAKQARISKWKILVNSGIRTHIFPLTSPTWYPLRPGRWWDRIPLWTIFFFYFAILVCFAFLTTRLRHYK